MTRRYEEGGAPRNRSRGPARRLPRHAHPVRATRAPAKVKKHHVRARIIALTALIVTLSVLAGISLYRGDPTRYLYLDAGYQFHLTSGESTQVMATIVSADTTAPVPPQLRTIRRTGRLWTDLASWLKKDTRSFRVTRITGLSSKNAPIDLSKLTTDTALALEGQSVRYAAPGYSLVATQTGDTLMVEAVSIEDTTLPGQLFTDFDGHPLAVKLSPDFEAKLLASIADIAATPVNKSTEYNALTQRIDQLIKPYASVMSETLIKEAQTTKAQIKDNQTELRRSEGIILDVPVISQRPDFKAGCEAASTAMLITYGGHRVSTAEIIDVMPYSSDPSRGFVGDPRTWKGYTIYPSAMKGVVQKYLGSGVDLTGCGMGTLKDHLLAGKPVVCWFGAGALPSISPHCVCVTGYRQGTIYYNDPYLNTKNKPVSESTFRLWWGEMDYHAMSY